MASRPVALGMTLCDYVIIDERTKKVSVIGSFNRLNVGLFPAAVQPFSVVAILSGGLGEVRLELVVSRLDTGAAAVAYRSHFNFTDKLAEVFFEARLQKFLFPVSGFYQFTLLAEGEWLAQRRLLLSATENQT